ncbi:NAD(P)-binding protein [Acrodontium crateriforme]|uniref:NAD(P)-binding protein n=1 Tax=Acrodontium crateriforme TaxID=150365 RepID=A0AAQ3MBD5_9PEZI|nr:NAD(P)-binding protein [Acrodontium crateriforme]
MSSSNHLKNIAIVGATGRSGSYMVESLLAKNTFIITAITREESTAIPPQGLKVAKVNYSNHGSLVSALKAQDALVITLSTIAQNEQSALFRAAADANVPWILPNEWAPDTANEDLCRDVGPFQKLADFRKELESLGKSSWIGISCSFWYEWSLGIAPAYGFDIPNKQVTFFDDGTQKINTSTWAQVGRAVAGVLSLPIRAENGVKSDECLEHFRNKMVYISSFTVSQMDMFDSILRVTGDKASEWKVTHENSKERWAKGFEDMKKGDRMGFARYMYTRVFFPDGVGNFEKTRGLQNELLGLPHEDIDKATKVAIERSKTNPWA